MDPKDFNVRDEQQLYKELAEWDGRRAQQTRSVSENLSNTLDDLVRAVPQIDPSVAMSTAQAIQNGQMSYAEGVDMANGILERQIQLAAAKEQQEQQDNRGALGKIFDKSHELFKSGAKWTFAGLEFAPQIVQNVGSRAYQQIVMGDPKFYDAPDTGFFEGLVASTDLGTLLSGVESGNGYFLGEAAKEQQTQAAREYRGTINGEAWSFGRSFASVFAEPNSRRYNILSGLVDAGAAITVPVAPGAKLGAKALGPVADLTGLRRTAGLSNFGSAYIDTAKAERWLTTSRGIAVRNKIENVKTMDEAMSLFPKADAQFWGEVVDANNEGAVLGLLERSLGLREGLNKVDDLKIGSVDEARRRISLRSDGSLRGSGRLSAVVPGREFVLDAAGPREITQTVRNADAYLKTVRADAGSRNKILKQLTDGLTTNNREMTRNALREMQNIVKKSMVDNTGVFKRRGSESMIDDMFERFRGDVDRYAYYGRTDSKGLAHEYDNLIVDVDGVRHTDVRMKGGVSELETEAQRFSTFFPDPRNIRRATSKYSWFWTKSAQNSELYGDAKSLITALDFIQNKVWRPMTLMTGGYIFRNMLESIMRQTTARGIASGPTHPLQWIQSMMGYTFKGDLEGTAWLGSAGRMAKTRNKEYFEATGAKVRELQDPMYLSQQSYKSGRFKLVANDESADFAEGMATELRLLAGDDVARRIASSTSDDPVRETVEWLMSSDGEQYLQRLQARWTNRTVIDKNGNEVVGSVVFKGQDGQFVEQNLYEFVKSVDERIKVKTGGNQQLVDVVANKDGYGTFVTSDGRTISAFSATEGGGDALDGFSTMRYNKEFLDEVNSINVATRNTDNALPDYVKIDVPLDDQMLGGIARTKFFDRTMDHFFTSVFGRKESFLNRSPVFRQYYYKKINDLVQAGEVTPEALRAAYNSIAEGAIAQADEQVKLLRGLQPTPNGKFEWDGKLISETTRDRLLRKAERNASKTGDRVKQGLGTRNQKTFQIVDDEWAARYVGSEDLWRTIKSAHEGKYVQPESARYARLKNLTPDINDRYIVDGVSVTKKQYDELLEEARGLSKDQLSFVGKAFAIEETKRVFYNASEVSNLADIMRIAVPFGPAWGEALRFYRKEVLTKPNRLKNMSVTAQGFRDMDPDGDGKGFIYKDPQTGEMVFNYPFAPDMIPIIGAVGGGLTFETLFGRKRSGPLMFGAGAIAGGGLGIGGRGVVEDRLDGVDFSLVAPAQSLSQSFQVLPGFGPAVQMSAQRLLGSKPQFDEFLQFIAPFGSYEDPLETIVPSWAKKIAAAVTADPDTDRLYASLYVDAFRSIYATGNYDNTNVDEMQELRQRARDVSRTLLVLRGMGQFVGPVRPEPELIVPTKFEGEITVNDVEMMVENNIPASVLASVFRDMQDKDFENAVFDFLAAFGDDTMMFLPGLSQANVQGLQATDLFGDWERRNNDVRDKFPDVYGYFAPSGGQFELQTYLRQIREKNRERISDPQEIQADAEAVVGKALYIHQVRLAGKEPTPEARDALKAYRTELEAKLPGFKTQALNINEREQILDQILSAADNESLADNQIAQSINTYNVYRDQMLEIALARDGNPLVGQLQPGQTEEDYKKWLRSAGTGRLGLAGNADLRQWLRTVGDRVSVETPEFERVWNRVLFDEVDV
jgi:hypothetical protein